MKNLQTVYESDCDNDLNMITFDNNLISEDEIATLFKKLNAEYLELSETIRDINHERGTIIETMTNLQTVYQNCLNNNDDNDDNNNDNDDDNSNTNDNYQNKITICI